MAEGTKPQALPTAAAIRAAKEIESLPDHGLEALMIRAGAYAERFGITPLQAMETMAARIIDEQTGLPELLAAAKAALIVIEMHYSPHCGAANELRGAIAKAEGVQP